MHGRNLCGTENGNRTTECYLWEKLQKAEAEVERLSKLTEDCLNVIRVYCPKYYNDAMERFKQTDK